jgi:hypothetical protein
MYRPVAVSIMLMDDSLRSASGTLLLFTTLSLSRVAALLTCEHMQNFTGEKVAVGCASYHPHVAKRICTFLTKLFIPPFPASLNLSLRPGSH